PFATGPGGPGDGDLLLGPVLPVRARAGLRAAPGPPDAVRHRQLAARQPRAARRARARLAPQGEQAPAPAARLDRSARQRLSSDTGRQPFGAGAATPRLACTSSARPLVSTAQC